MNVEDRIKLLTLLKEIQHYANEVLELDAQIEALNKRRFYLVERHDELVQQHKELDIRSRI